MRRVPDPGFAGDVGATEPALAEALTSYEETGKDAPVLAALTGSRVLVPVVAIPGEVEYDDAGRAREKSADIAAVLMKGRDGRLALLAFTCLESMRAWDPSGRPVPVTTRDAATSALQENASALLIDVAGPVSYVVETPALEQIAAGHVLRRTRLGYAWLAPAPDG